MSTQPTIAGRSSDPAVEQAGGERGRPAPHALLTEFRRGIGLPAGLAVLLTALAAMLLKTDQWQGNWTATTGLLTIMGTLICGPMAVAAGCWQGGRERRRGTGELLGSLPTTPLRRAMLAAAPAVLGPVLGYALAAVICLGATWPYAGPDRPFLSLIVADAVGIGVLGFLGFVAGRTIPWWPMTPLLPFATYITLGAGVSYSAPRGLVRLFPGIEQGQLQWQQPVWWYGPALTLWTAALAAAVLVAYAGRRRLLAVVPLAVAVAAAVPVAQTGDAVMRPDPAAIELVCTDSRPTVCLTRSSSRLLPSVTQALDGLRTKLRGVDGAPRRFVESRRAGRDRDTVPLYVNGLRGRLLDPYRFTLSTTMATMNPDCPDSTWATGRPSLIGDGVRVWLFPQDSFEGFRESQDQRVIDRTVQRLETMPVQERRTWLGDYYTAARSCRPNEVKAP